MLLQTKMPRREIAKAVEIARSALYHELERRTVTQLDSELRTHQLYFSRNRSTSFAFSAGLA